MSDSKRSTQRDNPCTILLCGRTTFLQTTNTKAKNIPNNNRNLKLDVYLKSNRTRSPSPLRTKELDLNLICQRDSHHMRQMAETATKLAIITDEILSSDAGDPIGQLRITD
jgi:hypothetical protein